MTKKKSFVGGASVGRRLLIPTTTAAAAAVLQSDPHTSVLSAGTQRKRRIASIFQHYYPEGDWGYVILVCAFLVQVFSHGLQMSFGVLATAIARRWRLQKEEWINIGKRNDEKPPPVR